MRYGAQDLWQRRGKTATTLRNIVRRLDIISSAGGEWGLEGFEDGEGNTETDVAEIFPGVGFYSRPAEGKGEALVAKVGAASDHPAIVATRDQDALDALEEADGEAGPDEAGVFNRSACVRVIDGEVWIRSHGGAAAALPTMADLQRLQAAIAGAGSGGAVPGAAAAVVFIGTRVLRGE